MKNVLTLFLCLAMFGLYGQSIKVTESPDSFREQIDYILRNLDFSELTTGYLKENTVPIYPIERLDGKEINDSTIVTIEDVTLLYQMMDDAATGNYGLPPIDNIKDTRENLTVTDAIPFVVFRHRYDKIRDDAVDNNLLSVSTTQYFDVPNRTESPYIEDTLFVASPMIYTADTLTLTFKIDASFVFNNQATVLNQMLIDFDDGNGYQTLNLGDQITVNYGEYGTKIINVKETGNKPRRCRSYLHLREDATLKTYDSETPDETVSFEIAGTNGAEINISYASCLGDSMALRKPFIYIQGFNPPNGNMNLTYEDLFENKFDKLFNDGNQFLKLKDELSSAQYDLIYVNFRDMREDLRNSAAILDTIIRFVNAQKALAGSTEENVIMGSSAGGIIAKYAMLSMQNEGVDHEVGTFFSYDAALRGSNVSLGVQGFTDHVAGINILPWVDVEDLFDQLRIDRDALGSTAAKQLTVLNIYDSGADGEIHGPEYTAFFNELDAMGELNMECQLRVKSH